MSSSSGSGKSRAIKYISCIFEVKFFINGAIKSATLLGLPVAHAVSPVLTGVVGLPPTTLYFSARGHEFYPCQNGTGAIYDPIESSSKMYAVMPSNFWHSCSFYRCFCGRRIGQVIIFCSSGFFLSSSFFLVYSQRSHIRWLPYFHT